MCFLPNCRYHLILIGNIKELLQKLYALCFNYQHVDCLCIHFSSTASVAKVLSRVDNSLIICRGQFISNKQNRWVDRMPSFAKKKLFRKKYKKHLLSSCQKIKAVQTGGSMCADRIEQGKRTKLELELIKILDCFLEGHGNYTSHLVSFKRKWLNSKKICISQLVVQMI